MAWNSLKPGGWIEHTDMSPYILDDSPAPVSSKVSDSFFSAGQKTGRVFNITRQESEKWMKEVEFTSVNSW